MSSRCGLRSGRAKSRSIFLQVLPHEVTAGFPDPAIIGGFAPLRVPQGHARLLEGATEDLPEDVLSLFAHGAPLRVAREETHAIGVLCHRGCVVEPGVVDRPRLTQRK